MGLKSDGVQVELVATMLLLWPVELAELEVEFLLSESLL